MAAIDRVLPDWDVHEVHKTLLDASPAAALAGALAAPAAPDAIVRLLLRLRGVPPGGSIEDLFRSLGFELLVREADEIVVGAAGRPWRRRGDMRALGDAAGGMVRIVANFRVEDMAGGRTRLSTETRVAAVDEHARLAFRRYWCVVGPFSSLIRRRWLVGVRRSLAR